MVRFWIFIICFCSINASAQSDLKTVFESLHKNIQQNGEAYEQLKKSTTEIGHRLTGSVNGFKAEEAAYELFKSYGYNPEYQEFELEGWSRGTLELSINGRAYPAVALAHTPLVTEVKGDIIDMGNGLEADYAQKTVKGKIVFAALGLLPGSPSGTQNLHRSQKTALAIKHGAKAIILFNSSPGEILLTGTASVTRQIIEIPALSISNNNGNALKAQLAKSKHVASISMTNNAGKVKSRNIIATIQGSELPEEEVLIGGHLDSWDLATGAIDNGIGSFAILDMARAFKQLNLTPKRTIKFVLFMGEEQGLLGSRAYVAQKQQTGELEKVKYMLNFDMTNNPNGFHTSTEEDKDLIQQAGAIMKEVVPAFENNYRSGMGLHSDHQPFMLQGIPTGGATGHLSRETLNCYHADCDDFNWVNKEELNNTVQFGAMLLYTIADAQTLNAKKMNDQQLIEKLKEAKLETPLRISGDWRWE